MLRRISQLAFFLMISTQVFGQIAVWDVGGNVGAGDGDDPLSADSVGENITSAVMTLGSGVSASAANDTFGASGFTETSLSSAISANDYISITVTASGGFEIDFTSIDFLTGIASSLTENNFNVSLQSDATGFNDSSSLHDYSFSNTSPSAQSVTLSGVSGLQNRIGSTEFRLYGWKDSDGGTSTFRIRSNSGDDLEIFGSVSAVPEPSSFAALMGLGALGLVATRRRGKNFGSGAAA